MELSLFVLAVVGGVLLAAVLSGLLAAAAVLALVTISAGCGWVLEGRRMTKGDDPR